MQDARDTDGTAPKRCLSLYSFQFLFPYSFPVARIFSFVADKFAVLQIELARLKDGMPVIVGNA